jgi:hypothetical protein
MQTIPLRAKRSKVGLRMNYFEIKPTSDIYKYQITIDPDLKVA